MRIAIIISGISGCEGNIFYQGSCLRTYFKVISMRYVLHADDSQSDRWDLKYLIKDLDPEVEVIGFTNGLELLHHIEAMQSDALLKSVVFLDVRMPLWDGIRTLKVLQANPAYSFIPVYMWSVAESHSEMKLYMKEGARDFLIKPVQQEEWDNTKAKLKEVLNGGS